MTEAYLQIMIDEEGNVSSVTNNNGHTTIDEEKMWKLVKHHAEARIRKDLCGVFIQIASDGNVQKNVIGIENENSYLKESPWLIQLIVGHLNRILEEGDGKRLNRKATPPFIFSDLLDPENPPIFPLDDQWTEDY
ncbi:MAG: hypothetical protein ACQEP6_02385 [Patescibacteria group bacterium]